MRDGDEAVKLTREYHTPSETSIAHAVDDHCYDTRDGSVETALATARKTAEFIGVLTETLFDNGMLLEADILRMLPGWKKASR